MRGYANGYNEKPDNRGHKLADDGVTVLETFALPYLGERDIGSRNQLITSQWEFVRQYMENGPARLIGQVTKVMNVSDKRETFVNGAIRFADAMGSFWIIAFPIVFLTAIGRWIANHTSRIPKWPPEIEAECKIEPNDPYLCDAQHLSAQAPVVDDEGETDFRK